MEDSIAKTQNRSGLMNAAYELDDAISVLESAIDTHADKLKPVLVIEPTSPVDRMASGTTLAGGSEAAAGFMQKVRRVRELTDRVRSITKSLDV